MHAGTQAFVARLARTLHRRNNSLMLNVRTASGTMSLKQCGAVGGVSVFVVQALASKMVEAIR
jgi:hypothetical protein